MRRNKRSFRLTAVTLQAVLLTFACRDSPTGPDASLTDSEIVEVVKTFGIILSSGLVDGSEAAFGTTKDRTCNGGTVTIELGEPESDDEEGLFFVFSYELNPQGCTASAAGGVRIQLYGDPAIGGDVRMQLEEPPGPFSLRIAVDGGFRYETNDDRAGACQVDVRHSIEGTLNSTQGSSGTTTLRGSVCGLDIDHRESS